MAITQDNIVGGKIKINGSVYYSLVEIVHGGTGAVIWPAATTYVIDTTTLVLHYTSSVNWILASGQNYCYATADVKVMRGGAVQRTITGAALTATEVSGTYASNFSISSGNIYGNYLGTTPVNIGTTQNPQGYYCTASFVYIPEEGSQSEAVTAIVNQQYNIKDTQNPTVTNVQITVTPKQGDVVVDTIDFNSQTVNFYGTIIRSVLYNWTSTATEPGVDTNGTMRVYLNGSSSFVTVISNGEYYPWSIAENTTLNDRDFTLKLAYSEDTSYWNDATITQERGIITYGIPVIYSYGCDMIPASGTEPGDSVSPYGYARQPYYINGHQNPDGYEYPEVSWYPASFTALSLGTTETSTPTYIGSSTGSCTAHGKSATQVSVDCYQEINEKFYNGRTTGTKIYDGGWYIYHTDYGTARITEFSANMYDSPNNPCPASGTGYQNLVQLTATGTVQRYDTLWRNWHRTDIDNYSYSSGAEKHVDIPVSGHDVDYSGWYDDTSETPTITGGGNGFSLDATDLTVLIDNRANVEGADRSGTFTATFHNATPATVTLYQEANEAYPKYEPIHSLSIQHTGSIPASGGTYTVNYVARKETWTEYSSGYETTHVTSAETLSVDGFNCTPSVNSISGAGSFTITVGQNGSSSRTVTVSAGDASDYRTQDAAASVYTMVLEYNNVVIQNNGYIEADGQTIYIYDTGNNARNYTITKETGSALSITFDSANARFVVTHIDSSTLEWVQIYESSSNTTIRFQIYGYS